MNFRNGAVLLTAVAIATAGSAAAQTEHFHPKGKPPSEHTIAVLEQAKKTLPLSDTRDFDEQKKGFIASPDSWQIQADAGHVAWDDVSPYPVAMAVAIAASAAFVTPVSTPVVTLVVAPGNYGFLDFVKVGLPLLVLTWATTLLVTPIFFPF